MDYRQELDVALHIVHIASLLTKTVLRSLKNNVSAETKADASPVTVADFATQAVLIAALHTVFPQDAFIGEENADALRQNENLTSAVWELVQRAKNFQRVSCKDRVPLGNVRRVHSISDAHEVPLSLPASSQDMLELIDRGGKTQQTSKGRVWCMDPIDGTATFMQGQQYAVCLCLLVDGVQQVCAIGCPNLSFNVHGPLENVQLHEDDVDKDGFGVILSAVKGQGTFIQAMHETELGNRREVNLSTLMKKSTQDLNFVEATLGKTSLSQSEHKAVAELLGAKWPGTIVWSQQCKYVALTLGISDVMLRIPKTKDRFTCIWDHAGGQLLFTEAGGMIQDFNGESIDFAQGRLIRGERNHGMLAARPHVFEDVRNAVQYVLEQRNGHEKSTQNMAR